MSAVMYGRREGQQREMIKELPKIGLMAQGIDPRSVAVLQPNDWQRIQNNLTRYNRAVEKQEAQKHEREELHSLSKDLVKHWENTIEGQRLKKLQARKNREETEEIERQKIDIAEAKLQAEKRKVAIERAKQLQYYETDRVKGFHGALLLTEVLKERDAQIEMKKAKHAWQIAREEQLQAHQKKNNKEAIKADMIKAHMRFEKTCALSKFQQLQVKERDKKIKEEKAADFEEGKAIEKQAEIYYATREAIAAQNRHEKSLLKDSYMNEIKFKKEREKELQEMDEIENSKMRKFVNAKRKMAVMRKEKEQELFQAFQNHTEKMRDRLHTEMQQKVDDEDDRIAKAVAEREKNRNNAENEKMKAQTEALRQIKEHRLAMISDAERIREETMRDNKEQLKQRTLEDSCFYKSVLENNAKRWTQLSALQTHHKNQMAERQVMKKQESVDQLKLDKKNTELLAKEEEIFQEYANNVIDDAIRGKRNPFPLIKAKMEGPGGGRGPKFEGNAGLRPSYIVADATGVQLPHYVKGEVVYNQSYGHVGRSGKRIGFTW